MSGRHAVGILGAGRIGRLHGQNIVARVPELRLVAVADSAPGAAAALADELGCEAIPDGAALFERADVEAVLVCTPPDVHVAQLVAAAEARKHVFCEKPLAPDLAGADRALAALERAGVVVQVGYNRRFDRNFAAVREAVAAGRVGDPVLLRITARDPEPPPREYLPHSPGLFLDTTSHDLDLARFVLGAEIVEVTARAAALVDPFTRELGGVDTAVTTVVFDSGALGAIDNCWRSAYGYDQRLEVHGSDGMVLAQNETQSTALVADAAGFHAPVLPHFYLDRYGEAFVRELRAFAAALDGSPVPVSGRDGRQALAAALAAQRSLDEGRAIPLAELE